jgi:4-amino-4-deoxy-L-arabinose transferase-like glycosyltransferase
MSRPPSRFRAYHPLLAAAVALGAALRWHHLGWENLWLDEAYSVDLARRAIDLILREGWTDIHPPLYYLTLHYWIPLGGTSEAGARLLSAIFDVGTIAATYAVGARLAGGWVGAVAALLVAISPFHVEFGQEARMYALLGLTSTLSMHAFAAMCADRRAGAIAGYVAATTTLLYTHIYSFFVLAAQGVAIALWLSFGNRSAARRAVVTWAGALAAVVLLYSPWIVVLANQASRVHASFWIPKPTWGDGASVFQTYAGSRPLALIIGILAIAGAALLFRSRRGRAHELPPLAILAPWLVMPIVLPLIASRIATPIFLPKYAIAASIPFAILAAYGLARLPRATLAAPVALVIGALAYESLTTFYETRRREGWKTAVNLVESLAEPGDVLLFYPGFNHFPFDYYRTRDDLTGAAFPLEPLVPIPPKGPLDDMLQDTVGDKPRVWLIALQGAPERIPIGEGLGRTRTEMRHIVVEWIEADLFERPK